MTVSGQKKISIYDPATGTVVQLNNISEEGEFEKKGSFIKTSAGNRMYSGDESKAEFLSLDWTGYDQLVTWMKNRTPVRFVTYGLDEHILWYEDTYITVDQKTVFAPFKRSGFKIYFEKAGGVHAIYKGSNILYISRGWGDSNADGLADGYAFSLNASHIATFVNGIQNINANGIAGAAIMESAPICYPIVGAALQYSLTDTSINSSIRKYISGSTFNNSTILTSSSYLYGIDTFMTGSGMFYIYCRIINNDINLDANTIIKIADPYIGIPLGGHKQIAY